MSAATDVPDGFTFVDSPGEAGNPVPSTDLRCEYCGTGLVYVSGRRPKYCPDHRTPSQRKETYTARTGSKSKVGSVPRAIDSLEFLYKVLGTGLQYVNPPAGTIVAASSRTMAESYTRLLETNAKFLKLFESVETSTAWIPILVAHGQVVMAIMAIRNGGISPQEDPQASPDVANNADTPVAPTWAGSTVSFPEGVPVV